MPTKRWDPNANTIFAEKVRSGQVVSEDVNVIKGGPKFQDSVNKAHFKEYCDFTAPAKVYQARKQLKDKCIAWQLGPDQNKPRYGLEDLENDDDNPQDPPSTPPSPTTPRRPEPPQEDIFVNAVADIFKKVSVSMSTYNLNYQMPWLQCKTNWKETGEMELVYDFLAPPFGLSKFDCKVSDDGNFLYYQVKLPCDFYDPKSRLVHPGTEESMRGSCGDVYKNEPNVHDGVLSNRIQVGPLPFKVESAIRSIELIAY